MYLLHVNEALSLYTSCISTLNYIQCTKTSALLFPMLFLLLNSFYKINKSKKFRPFISPTKEMGKNHIKIMDRISLPALLIIFSLCLCAS